MQSSMFKQLRNGGYVTSPWIGKFCGNRIDPTIPSHSNQIFIQFRSDGSYSAPGFEIFWDGTTIGMATFLLLAFYYFGA